LGLAFAAELRLPLHRGGSVQGHKGIREQLNREVLASAAGVRWVGDGRAMPKFGRYWDGLCCKTRLLFAAGLDLSIDARVSAIVSLLIERGVGPDEQILDAGCGTGRYASQLASRGFAVLGIDSSAQMVEVARKQPITTGATLQFSVGGLTSFKHPGRFGAILCT